MKFEFIGYNDKLDAIWAVTQMSSRHFYRYLEVESSHNTLEFDSYISVHNYREDTQFTLTSLKISDKRRNGYVEISYEKMNSIRPSLVNEIEQYIIMDALKYGL